MPQSQPHEILIYRYLQEKGPKTREEIAEDLHINKTTVSKAFRTMRKLQMILNGEEVDLHVSIPKSKNGFYIDAKQNISIDEATALMNGILLSKMLSPEQRENLIDKIWTLLPKDQSYGEAPRIKSYQALRRHDTSKKLFEYITKIHQAREDSRRIHFKYRKQKFTDTTTEIHDALPLDVYFNNEKYYLLVAAPKEAGMDYGIQSYRIDLIKEISVGNEFLGKWPSDADIAAWLQQTDSSLKVGATVEEVKLIATQAGLIALYDVWGEQNLKVTQDPDSEDRFRVVFKTIVNEDELINFALANAPQIEITNPQELRDNIRSRTYFLQKLYLSSDDDKEGERYNAILRGDGLLYTSDRTTRTRLDKEATTHHVKYLVIDGVLTDLDRLSDTYPNVRTITFLNQSKINLRDISKFKALESLTVHMNRASTIPPTITNIKELARCTILKELDLESAYFNTTDFEASCKSWPRLRQLNIALCDVKSLDFLKHIPHLRVLEIGGTHLQNLDGLKYGRWLHRVTVDKSIVARFGNQIKAGVYNKTIHYRNPRGRLHTLYRKTDPDPNINHKINRK